MQCLVKRLFGLEILEDSLDDQIGVRYPVTVDIRPYSIRRSGPVIGIGDFLAEQSGRPPESRVDVFSSAILQGNFQATQRAPCRDVTTHDTGTDNMHVFNLLFRLAALRFQAVLQKKYTDQVARSAAGHQVGKRSCLRVVAGTFRGAVLRPEINNRVWSRVVFLPRPRSDLLLQESDNERSQEKKIEQPFGERRSGLSISRRNHLTGRLFPIVGRNNAIKQVLP